MSEKKGATIVETVIIGSLFLAVLLIVLWYFGRAGIGMFSVGSEGMTGKGAETNRGAASPDIHHALEKTQSRDMGFMEAAANADKFSDSQVEAQQGSSSPSFKGYGNFGELRRVGASSVIDDSPVPPDGGGLPSKELPSKNSRKQK